MKIAFVFFTTSKVVRRRCYCTDSSVLFTRLTVFSATRTHHVKSVITQSCINTCYSHNLSTSYSALQGPVGYYLYGITITMLCSDGISIWYTGIFSLVVVGSTEISSKISKSIWNGVNVVDCSSQSGRVFYHSAS